VEKDSKVRDLFFLRQSKTFVLRRRYYGVSAIGSLGYTPVMYLDNREDFMTAYVFNEHIMPVTHVKALFKWLYPVLEE